MQALLKLFLYSRQSENIHIYIIEIQVKETIIYNGRDFPITCCAAHYTDRIATATGLAIDESNRLAHVTEDLSPP